jgi:DMATS type aromatic prenyltransferase
MTDDHNPIELSWDWRTGDKSPKIRFSIEPIGLDAGTSLDPYNQFMVSKFPETLVRLLPQINIEWLSYFQQQLNGEEATGSVEGHSTTGFYAFDLDHGAIVSKAYFFPGFKAKANKRTNFQVIQETIQVAPGSTPDNLRALVKFQRYVDDPTSPPLEMDMLAIDLVDPSESRFKIYFRTRDTSFASIRHTMTLGDRVQQPGIEQGLEDLRRLYYALFGSEEAGEAAEDEELPTNDHRTAGILYNVEFRYGSSNPKVKAYLPVRHYARNEAAVISALSIHSCRTGPFAKTNMSNYKDAMESIL